MRVYLFRENCRGFKFKLVTFIPQRLIKFATNHPSLNGNKHLSDKDYAFPTYNVLNIFQNLIKKSI